MLLIRTFILSRSGLSDEDCGSDFMSLPQKLSEAESYWSASANPDLLR